MKVPLKKKESKDADFRATTGSDKIQPLHMLKRTHIFEDCKVNPEDCTYA